MDYVIAELEETRISQTVKIWRAGWHEAHAKIVPEQLVRLRTRESFLKRLRDNFSNTRIALVEGIVVGICILKKDELYQMYVSPKARGRGVANALITDAEDRLRHMGYLRVWLACAVGNVRAAKFYEKSGWENVGAETVELDTSEGSCPLHVWRFEKELR